MGTFKTVDCWILKHQQRPGNYGTHQRPQGFITAHWNTLRKQKQHLSYHCVIKVCRSSLITCPYQGCSLRLEPMEACTGWETGYILDNSLVHHSSLHQEPSCCEVAVLTTAPPCCLQKSLIFPQKFEYSFEMVYVFLTCFKEYRNIVCALKVYSLLLWLYNTSVITQHRTDVTM